MNIIHRAAQAAATLHEGQTRACGEPYINHPARVANMVMLREDRPGLVIMEDMIVAAWLHDVYEDSDIRPPALASIFNPTVNKLVVELTNLFTKVVYPELNRAQRKAAEVARLGRISPQAQVIKLCDRIDNLRSIGAMDRGFAMLYCYESNALAHVLTASPTLQEEIFKLTKEIRTNE